MVLMRGLGWMEPEHWYNSLKRSNSHVLYNVESSPSLATHRSVALQTDRIHRWVSSSRSSILRLLAWTLCRMRAVVASAARRVSSLLSKAIRSLLMLENLVTLGTIGVTVADFNFQYLMQCRCNATHIGQCPLHSNPKSR